MPEASFGSQIEIMAFVGMRHVIQSQIRCGRLAFTRRDDVCVPERASVSTSTPNHVRNRSLLFPTLVALPWATATTICATILVGTATWRLELISFIQHALDRCSAVTSSIVQIPIDGTFAVRLLCECTIVRLHTPATPTVGRLSTSSGVGSMA